MIDSISKYVYIDEKMFGDGPRVQIDGNVVGNREQSRIRRTVDQYYLKETEATWNGTALPDSVTFEFPIPVSTELPVPSTTGLADPDKLDEFSLDGDDTYYWTGGENPDYEKLIDDYNAALGDMNSRIDSANSKYDNDVDRLKDERDSEILSIRERRENLLEIARQATEEFGSDVSAAEDSYSESLDDIRSARKDLARRLSSGEIDRRQYEDGMVSTDEDEYDAVSTRTISIGNAWKDYSGSYSTAGNGLYECKADEIRANEAYSDGVEDSVDERDGETAAARNEFLSTSSEIFTDSNGTVGEPEWPKYRKALSDIAGLGIYRADEHVDRGIPWLGEKDWKGYVEYNDRLMYVWDKCRWTPLTMHASKLVHGYMESYDETMEMPDWEEGQTYSLTSSFKRWHYSEDTIYFAEEWGSSPGSSATSTFDIGSTSFKFRFGNRHQVGKASTIKAAIYFSGSGEDGIGRRYGIVQCTRSGVAQKAYVDAFDAEDDLHLKRMKDIEEEYRSEILEIENTHMENTDDIEGSFEFDVSEMNELFEYETRSSREQFVSGVSVTAQTANTKKMNGEDNSSELEEISNAKASFDADMSSRRERLEAEISRRRVEMEADVDRENERYASAMSEAEADYTSELSDEETRHATAIEDILSSYESDRSSFMDWAENTLTEAIESANEDLASFQAQEVVQKEQFGKSRVDVWNSRHPEAQLPEGFNPWTDPLPEAPTQEIEEIFTRPMWEYTKSRQQPTNDAFDKRLTEIAEATRDYEERMSEWDDLDLENREVWTFSASSFAAYGGRFSSSSGEGQGGMASVRDLYVIGAWADMDYGLTTGAEHKDYESEDNGNEGE